MDDEQINNALETNPAPNGGLTLILIMILFITILVEQVAFAPFFPFAYCSPICLDFMAKQSRCHAQITRKNRLFRFGPAKGKRDFHAFRVEITPFEPLLQSYQFLRCRRPKEPPSSSA